MRSDVKIVGASRLNRDGLAVQVIQRQYRGGYAQNYGSLARRMLLF